MQRCHFEKHEAHSCFIVFADSSLSAFMEAVSHYLIPVDSCLVEGWARGADIGRVKIHFLECAVPYCLSFRSGRGRQAPCGVRTFFLLLELGESPHHTHTHLLHCFLSAVSSKVSSLMEEKVSMKEAAKDP